MLYSSMDLPLFAVHVPDGKEALRGGQGRIVFIQIGCNEQKENTKKRQMCLNVAINLHCLYFRISISLRSYQ